MTRDLALVVPAYNEASRLDDGAFLAYLASAPHSRIVFVDDGSTDGTADRLGALRAAAPEGRVDVIVMPRNGGKAEAVRAGLLHAIGSGAGFAGFADADLSAPLTELPALQAELERFPDAWAALGSRVKLLGRTIERSELRHYLGRVFATCASIALDLPVYDTQCGLKLFRNVPAVAAALSDPFTSRWIFDVELIARIAREAGPDVAHRIREVPLESWHERGSSRLKLRDFVRAPLELLHIRTAYRRH